MTSQRHEVTIRDLNSDESLFGTNSDVDVDENLYHLSILANKEIVTELLRTELQLLELRSTERQLSSSVRDRSTSLATLRDNRTNG